MRPLRPSRHMLTGELVLSLFALGYALSALIPRHIQSLILEHEGFEGLHVWVTFMGVSSALLVWTTYKELISPTMNCSSTLRCRLLLLQGLSWAYTSYLMVIGGHVLSIVTFHSIPAMLLCTWFYLDNRRVRREINFALSAG